MTGSANTIESIVVDPGASRSEGIALPRFTLRKRKGAPEPREAICLPSVNSDLLDGLFADVAEIQQTGNPPAVDDVNTSLDVAPALKKSRASLTHSISRSPKSFKWLGDALFPSATDLLPKGSTSDDLTRQVTPEPSTLSKAVPHSTTLDGCAHFPSLSKSRNVSPSFPHLPPAVSTSSCTTLPRIISDLQELDPEKEGKDSYGWFVDMDGEGEKDTVDPYHKSSSTNNLAFVASTAPNAEDHDAEVEWAKAADTVDSVLGDFF